jgi:hypothetical protein
MSIICQRLTYSCILHNAIFIGRLYRDNGHLVIFAVTVPSPTTHNRLGAAHGQSQSSAPGAGKGLNVPCSRLHRQSVAPEILMSASLLLPVHYLVYTYWPVVFNSHADGRDVLLDGLQRLLGVQLHTSGAILTHVTEVSRTYLGSPIEYKILFTKAKSPLSDIKPNMEILKRPGNFNNWTHFHWLLASGG